MRVMEIKSILIGKQCKRSEACVSFSISIAQIQLLFSQIDLQNKHAVFASEIAQEKKLSRGPRAVSHNGTISLRLLHQLPIWQKKKQNILFKSHIGRLSPRDRDCDFDAPSDNLVDKID